MLRSTNVDSGKGSPVPRIVWKTPVTKQRFSLPYTIMEYIASNPVSPECHFKLISSCKYFFNKNPVLPLYGMYALSKPAYEFWMKDHTVMFWFTGDIILKKTPSYDPFRLSHVEIASMFGNVCKHLYRSDVANFEMKCKASIKLEDFRACVRKAINVAINVPMTHSDGRRVRLEEVVGAIPNVRHLTIECHNNLIVDGDSWGTLSSSENLGKIEVLDLYSLPCDMDLNRILSFLKRQRVGESMLTNLSFVGDISDRLRDQFQILAVEISKIPNLNCYMD